MKTYFRITQYIYLFIALFLSVEVFGTWGENNTQTIILSVLALMGYFMFFFKRWHGKKMEQENSKR